MAILQLSELNGKKPVALTDLFDAEAPFNDWYCGVQAMAACCPRTPLKRETDYRPRGGDLNIKIN